MNEPSSQFRLFERSKLDAPDELEEKWRKYHFSVHEMISRASEKEAHDILTIKVCRGMEDHEEVSLGLLLSILTNPSSAHLRYSDLTFITRDGMNLVTNCLEFALLEKFRKMKEMTKKQIIWVVNEMIKNRFAGIEKVCYALLKQIEGGNISPSNIWLADSTLRLLRENREWLESVPWLVCSAVFTYLRLIQDHSTPSLTHLRNAEVDFCIICLRTQFTECAALGRDLVRLLQSVARIPQFAALWKDLLQNPTSLSSHFSGVSQLLTVRTSRRYIASLVTSDMENKLNFLLAKVKFGQQKRYQDWFQRDYLSTPESQSLIGDLIRYICCVIHPSNEVLSSDTVQRWAVIGWLLTKCQSNVAASNAKLALFYDWFFYNPEQDSIMNIEPGILIMSYSVNTHPTIAATLIDFLVRMIPAFGEGLEEQVSSGVNKAIRDLLEKRVIASLDVFLSSPRLDSVLTGSFQQALQPTLDHFQNPVTETGNSYIDGSASVDDVVFVGAQGSGPAGMELGVVSESIDEINEDESRVEPEEEPEVIQKEEMEGEMEGDASMNSLAKEMTRLPERWARKIEGLKLEGPPGRRKIVDELMESVVREVDVRSSQLDALAKCIALSLMSDFDEGCNIEVDMLDVGKMLPFSLFRHADPLRPANVFRRVLNFLRRIFDREDRLGYNLLFYVKARSFAVGDAAAASVYAAFAAGLDEDLESCIVRDMERCQTTDTNLFYFLIPGIYQQFPRVITGSSGLLYLIVSCIDSAQLHDLICQLSLGKFKLFGSEKIAQLLTESLDWETFEQISVWQLLMAENSPPEQVVKILPLDSNSHPEPLSGLVLFLRQHSPSSELLEAIFRMPASDGQFTLTVLKQWAIWWPKELTTPIVECLEQSVTTEQEGNGGSEVPTGKIIQYVSELRQLLPADNPFVTDPEMSDALAMFDATAASSQPSQRTPPSTPKWLKSGERKRSQSLSDNELDFTMPKPKAQRASKRILEDSDDESLGL